MFLVANALLPKNGASELCQSTIASKLRLPQMWLVQNLLVIVRGSQAPAW